MSNDDYHSDYSSVSKTMLNLFCQSPREYYLTYVTREMPPARPSAPMLVGTLLHSALLEGKSLAELVVPYPEECFKCDGTLNGKRAAVFREENSDAVCLKDAEYESIVAVYDAVMRDRQISQLISAATKIEHRYDAVLEGVPCKCKPDIVCEMAKHVVAYDLKCCLNVDPYTWQRSARRLRWWLQDCHYSAVLAAHFGKPVAFRFFVIETKFPFRVQWYYYDERSREIGRDAHRLKLEDLSSRHASGDWSDRWEPMVTLNPWEVETELLPDEVQV